MPTDLYGWLMAIYWPLCFVGAIVLTLVFVKKPVTRELLAVGFAVLLIAGLAQRLFWVVATTAEGDLQVAPELMAASTAIFGLGDLIAYLLIFVGLVIPGRKLTRATS